MNLQSRIQRYLPAKSVISSLGILAFLFFSFTSHAQNTFVEFGKNRIQHKRFYWRNLSTINFDIYYYDSGSRLANFATRFLELEFDKITDVLGYSPYFKTKIFIYNSISDLQQSNVGIDDENLITGGQTDFFKSQVEIPYTGSEEEFKQELRRGIALMLIREMMFGGSLKEMLQSSYLGKFSEWFLFGAAAYVADGWSEEMDDHVRDAFSRRKTKKPNLLSGQDAVLVGQSIWNYIAEEYGEANISNILNLARIIRNERNSIGSSLGVRYKTFLKRWENYYQGLSDETLEQTEPANYDFKLRKRNRKNFVFNEFKINPEGTKIAFSENRNGRYRIVVKDLRNRRRKVLTRTGYRAINQRYDDNVPLLSWRDNNNLGIMTIKKGETRIRVMNLRKKVSYERTWFFFNHISSFDFSDDGNFMIISADRKGRPDFKTGQNDIFRFDIENTNLDKITDDWYDDRNPVFLPGSNLAFAFSSNRLEDTLSTTLLTQQGNFDRTLQDFNLYIYDPRVSKTRLNQLTQSVGKDMNPRFLNRREVIYLNDGKGIKQLHRVNVETKEVNQISNYQQSVRTFDINRADRGLGFLQIEKGRLYPYYKNEFNFSEDVSSEYVTPRVTSLEAFANLDIPRRRIPEGFSDSANVAEPDTFIEPYEEDEIDTDNYQFNQEVVNENKSGLATAQQEMLNKARQASQNRVKVVGPYEYTPRFRTENVVTSVQIDPLRGWGAVLKMTTSDLLENHKIRGGYFLVTDLRSSDFFGEYEYLARRFDFGLRYDRKVIAINNDQSDQRYTLNRVEGTISFPIRNTSRISVSPFYATSLWVPLNFDLADRDDHRRHYGGVKVEYVYDNTILNGQNMISGTRMKVRYERFITLALNDGVTAPSTFVTSSGQALVSPGPTTRSGNDFDKITVDIRHYEKIHRDLILATRFSYGRFGGRAPKNFLVGGMDNWLFNRTDGGGVDPSPLATAATASDGATTIQIDNSDILFHEFVTNLRGFNYNKIAGDNYLLANIEIRFPIIKYLFGKRINSNFLKNLQLIGFYDVGTAWTGVSPFRRSNNINTRNISRQTFDITVNNFKNPFLQGYGAGLRTVLLGYYLKLDVAWGVEDFNVADSPKFYLTFGYDF